MQLKKNIYFCFIALTLSFYSIAQSNYLQQIPQNWKIILEAKGDLNKDNIEDLVLIIEDTEIRIKTNKNEYVVMNL